MTTWQIKFDGRSAEDAVVEAEYYQREDGWVTFKDDNNKVMLDVPIRGISSIQRVTLAETGATSRECECKRDPFNTTSQTHKMRPPVL